MHPRIYAIKLAKKLGMGLRQATPSFFDGVPSWNGSSLAIHQDTSTLFHEISHWLVAPGRRRRLTGFGLGREPTGVDCPAVVREPTGDREEAQASVLGICYERALDMDWWRTAEQHNWVVDDHNVLCGCDEDLAQIFFRAIARLNKRKLLRGWVPTITL